MCGMLMKRNENVHFEVLVNMGGNMDSLQNLSKRTVEQAN